MLGSSLAKTKKPAKKHQWGVALLLLFWVLAGYILAQVLVAGYIWTSVQLGVSYAGFDTTVLNVVMTAAIYLLSLGIVLIVPWTLKRRRTSLEMLGLQRLLSWKDIGLAPAGFVVYMVVSVVLLGIVTALLPGFDAEQVQQNGFEGITLQYQYYLAFATLVVIAPVAEEILFRGYLYGKLRTKVPLWAAILAVSILFAAIHGQWNVAVDVFALSIVLCVLRELTGSIWSGILLHMIKNGVAFYFLFVSPTIV